MGHDVICVDNDERKVAALQGGDTLIHENNLPELLDRYRNNKIHFMTDLGEATRSCQAIFIAVGTPQSETGDADLSYVEAVACEIARSINSYKVIVEKSTVPVYTSQWIRTVIIRNGAHPASFDLASNPEFLREGTAVSDFLYPDRIVVGVESERCAAVLREIYAPMTSGEYYSRADAIPRPDCALMPPRLIVTSTKSAELIKHASNAFLAMKISFIIMVANVSERVGADIEEVRKGIGSDKRIGQKFLRAGIGYGGSCFPKDVAAFQSVARACGSRWNLLEEVSRRQRLRPLVEVHLGDEVAEVGPAPGVPGEEDRVVALAPLQFRAEDRPDPDVPAGLAETDCPVHAVVVGEGERPHPHLGGPGGEVLHPGGSLPERVVGMDVEVDEAIHGRPFGRGSRGRG